MNIEPSLADAPAIRPEIRKGRVVFVVHGVVVVTSLADALDLIEDRRITPRPMQSFGAHTVSAIIFQHLVTLANLSAVNGRGTLDEIPGVPNGPRGNGCLDRAPWESSAA